MCGAGFISGSMPSDGRCIRTGIGDPPPPTACLFTFPTREAYGVVWAFNGLQPLFELVEPSRPLPALLMDVAEPMRLHTDPWVVCCNTPDWAHFAMVHRFAFSTDGQNESLTFEPFGVRRKFSATLEHGAGPTIDFDVCVSGTNLVLVEGSIEGKWFGVAACMGVPVAGLCDFYVVTLVDRSAEKSDLIAQDALRNYVEIGRKMLARGFSDLGFDAFQAGYVDQIGCGVSALFGRSAGISPCPPRRRLHSIARPKCLLRRNLWRSTHETAGSRGGGRQCAPTSNRRRTSSYCAARLGWQLV